MSEVKEVELSAEMKIQKANMQKEKGNEHFKVPFYKSTQSSIYPKIHNFWPNSHFRCLISQKSLNFNVSDSKQEKRLASSSSLNQKYLEKAKQISER